MVGDLILKLQGDLDITSVVVKHDIPLTLRISDRIALINEGKVSAEGSAEGIQESEVFRRFVAGQVRG